MRFDDNIDLDTSQISDRRGMGMPLVGGGGFIGVIFLLYTIFVGGDPAAFNSGTLEGADQRTDLAAECRTGVDANNRDDCRIVGVVNSVQAHWKATLPEYEEAPTVFFSGGTLTACGAATSAVGPFYCPADSTVYIDLSFYDELRSQFGANGGPFAEAYVIAHEYGHHLQNLLGILSRANDGASGAGSASVRVELMADCFAGAWAKNAESTGFISELTQQDIEDGLSAAAAVGDDRIQQRVQGRVDKESWTHGSADQRMRWFNAGYANGTVDGCNTFSARTL
jgi:predicted metalloprotease